jgi:tetratricopeptide (TPR) repeat protein
VVTFPGKTKQVKMNKKYSPEELYNIAFANHKKNNLRDAEKFYKEAIKQNPNHLNSLFYLAGLFAQRKFFNDAKELFEKVIKINPNYPAASDNLCSIYKMLASISLKNKRMNDAKNFFEKVLTLNPDDLEANHEYGILLLKTNKHPEGLNYIKKGTGFIRFESGSYKII